MEIGLHSLNLAFIFIKFASLSSLSHIKCTPDVHQTFGTRYFLLPLVIFFFLLCARLIWKMDGNSHLYLRTTYARRKYARTGEWKLRLRINVSVLSKIRTKKNKKSTNSKA